MLENPRGNRMGLRSAQRASWSSWWRSDRTLHWIESSKSIPLSQQPNFRLLLTISVSVRGCYTRKLAPARVHTGMTFWFRSHLHDDGSFHTSLILKCTSCWKKYSCDSKSQTLRMCYPFQPTGRFTGEKCLRMLCKNDTWSISGNDIGSGAKMPGKCCSDERSDGSFYWQW